MEKVKGRTKKVRKERRTDTRKKKEEQEKRIPTLAYLMLISIPVGVGILYYIVTSKSNKKDEQPRIRPIQILSRLERL